MLQQHLLFYLCKLVKLIMLVKAAGNWVFYGENTKAAMVMLIINSENLLIFKGNDNEIQVCLDRNN